MQNERLVNFRCWGNEETILIRQLRILNGSAEIFILSE